MFTSGVSYVPEQLNCSQPLFAGSLWNSRDKPKDSIRLTKTVSKHANSSLTLIKSSLPQIENKSEEATRAFTENGGLCQLHYIFRNKIMITIPKSVSRSNNVLFCVFCQNLQSLELNVNSGVNINEGTN